ncbi:MAG: aldo/keto reductase family protein [Aggregatilineales bacterium]
MSMQYRRLGTSGMKVSAISIGAWLTYGSDDVEFDMAKKCLQTAIEHGINFIDVADIYAKGSAEEAVGKAIADYDRTKLVISTKAYWPMSDDANDRGLSRKHIVESVHKSLKRLGTDYVDIFFCHRYDQETRTDETVRAIEDLIREGKILYWGTSMWTDQQIDEAVAAADKFNAYRPVVEQPLYNMLDRHIVEGPLEDTVAEHGLGLVVWSPLAGGVLTGKYSKSKPRGSRGSRQKDNDNFSADRIDIARKMSELAKELGVTPAALALAWTMDHPNVDSVITGATKPEHVTSNLKALEIDVDVEMEERIEEILQNRPPDSSRVITDPDEIVAI